jgi:hypothetical protein
MRCRQSQESERDVDVDVDAAGVESVAESKYFGFGGGRALLENG